MSDPMTNVEIEDVLSSIRRLVSEDLRGPEKAAVRAGGGLPPVSPVKTDGDAAVAKLVLTPAFRVAEPQAEAAEDTGAAGGDWLRDAEADTAVPEDRADTAAGPGTLEDTIAELEAAVAGIDDAFETEEPAVAETDAQEMPGFADVGGGVPTPDVAETGGPADAGDGDAGEDAVAAMPWKSLRTSTATLRSAPTWRPGEADADAGANVPAGSAEPASDDDLMVAPVAGDAMRFGRAAEEPVIGPSDAADTGPAPDEAGMDTSGGEAAAAGAVLFGAAAFRSPRIIRPVDYAADAGVAAEPGPSVEEDRNAGSDASADAGKTRSDLDPRDPVAQTEGDADAARDADGAFGLGGSSGAASDDAAEDAGLFDPADDLVIDADALRDLVAEIIRQELQGPLGERITRNVRKLVRREIARALDTKAMDGERSV